MGVHGLWRLIEPSGKPVPLETLENKVLAVDVSLWLHQAIKGFQDSKGAPLPNAHLLGIYHRVCKLLYFRIRPVFVFDGGVPILKKETIAKRNQLKAKNLTEANRLQKQLFNTLLKHSAIAKVISEKAKADIENTIQKNTNKPQSDDEVYKLPSSQLDSSLSSSKDSSDDSDEVTHSLSPIKNWDLHTVDEKSSHFKSLPADVRHEILTELKETRKQSSWGRIHELPTHSDDFSVFQMKRLLKRHSIQISLEEAEKEIGGHTLSLGELEALLNDHGVITSNSTVGSRIASDESTRYLLIKDVKKTLEKAMDKPELLIENLQQNATNNIISSCKLNESPNLASPKPENKNVDSEYENDLKRAIELSLQDIPSTSRNAELACFKDIKNTNDPGSDCSDNSVEDLLTTKILSSAKNYMVEYSGLTPSEIAKIIGENSCSSLATSNSLNKKEQRNNDNKTPQNISINNKEASAQENIKLQNNIELEGKEAVVEVMSEEYSSDSSDSLVEVTKASENEFDVSKISQNTLEVIIQPSENMEEDMFSDIFSSEKESSKMDSEVANTTTESEPYVKQVISVDSDTDLKKFELGNTTEDVTQKNTLKDQEVSTCHNNNGHLVSALITDDTVHVTGTDDNKLIDRKTHTTLLDDVLQPFNKDNYSSNNIEPLSTEQLKEISSNLIREKYQLISERSTKERLANNVTDQMYQEAQELLQLFGVPYIIAPMEAEAQCAFLNEINLTDGTITDDSDIWLFGGKTVYKNVFNQSKRVMEFTLENILSSFKLSRHEMILLALLVGSDYTTGVQGIGPVTALEILAAFPSKKTAEVVIKNYQMVSGLQDFQKWFQQGKIAGPGRATLRNKLKNIILTKNFPSLQVVQAYLEPKVETSREKFTWGKLDIVGLTDFAKEKFGWNHKKSEEILKPVLKRIEENNVQTKITNYFKTKHKIDSSGAESKMSKRVKTAVNKIGKEKKDLSSDDDVEVLKQTKKRSKKKVKQIESDLHLKLENKTKKDELEKQTAVDKTKTLPNLHKKEKIPQKEQDKVNLLRNKLKAIETFRKSKQGPGYRKKRQKVVTIPKEDAALSESSSD